jgi:hypothetical protein
MMNSLERAKRFLAEKTSRLALAVIPLAALAASAVPAHASVVFNVGSGGGNGNCSASVSPVGSGSCSSFVQGAIGGNGAANWIAIGGTGSLIYPSGGSIGFGISGGGASGSLGPGTIPVSWDFTLNSSSAGTIDWSLYFYVSFYGGGSDSFFLNGFTRLNGTSSVEVEGTGTIPIGRSGNVDGYGISFFSDSYGSFIAYSVDIPMGTSLDLNAGTAAPEPATLLLVPGAGAVLFLRRKKQK